MEWIAGIRTYQGYHGIILSRAGRKWEPSEILTAVWPIDAGTAEVYRAVAQLAEQLQHEADKEST